MRIALIRQHQEGGVAVVAEFVAHALSLVDVDVENIVIGDVTKSCTSFILTQLSKKYDVMHFMNIGAMGYVDWGSTPTSATIHHITHGYEPNYVAMINNYAPALIHTPDEFTRRQLGRLGIYNVRQLIFPIYRTYKPMPLPSAFTLGAIGGDAKYKRFDAIREIADELGVPCIIYDNADKWRSAEEVKEFYQQISCYVVASFEDAGPLPALEALQCGRPVLTTDVGCMHHYVGGHNGWYFDGSVEDGVRGARCIMKHMQRLTEGTHSTDFAAEDSITPGLAWQHFFEEVVKYAD